METLTWIINTDSLLFKNDKDYEECKINFQKKIESNFKDTQKHPIVTVNDAR